MVDLPEEIEKIRQQQDVLLCQYDGKFAKNYDGKSHCLYTIEMECKYRVSTMMPAQGGVEAHLDYLCRKWGNKNE
jgi:hypothetical protein